MRAIGGRDVSILLQDYAQLTLVPLPGRGLTDGEPLSLEGSPAGRAFLSETTVEQRRPDGVRRFLPLLDGSDEISVMALTLDKVDDDDRATTRSSAPSKATAHSPSASAAPHPGSTTANSAPATGSWPTPTALSKSTPPAGHCSARIA